VTLTERVRNSLPPQPNLRRVSLRTKLVASVLILVFAALTLISLASTYALHSYLISRMDAQLQQFAGTSVAAVEHNNAFTSTQYKVVIPPDYLATQKTTTGFGPVLPNTLSTDEVPLFFTTVDTINAHVGTPYTARSTRQFWATTTRRSASTCTPQFARSTTSRTR